VKFCLLHSETSVPYNLSEHVRFATGDCPTEIKVRPFRDDAAAMIYEYERLCGIIERCLDRTEPSPETHLAVVFFPELCRPTDRPVLPLESLGEARPLGGSGPEYSPAAQLVGMLALTFPDVLWAPVLPGCAPVEKGVPRIWRDGLRLGDFVKAVPGRRERHTTLFDPLGERSAVKAACGLDSVRRDPVAVAIDEEEPYSYLHAYAAYRAGFRCHVVSTQSMLDALFPKGPPTRPDGLSLALEDLFLGFADRVSSEHLSDLAVRDREHPGLASVPRRLFITVGHHNVSWYESNRRRIAEMRAAGMDVRLLTKPAGGIFSLLKRSGLAADLWRFRKREWKAACAGSSAPGVSGHSAPGRLLAIAERLIDRAERSYEDARSVPECIRGAVFALEALELLGCRTPTTSLEAIVLRHKLEVKAECMFQGMEYNIDVGSRFREIAGEVRAVSQWYNPATRRRSALNAEMSVATEIMGIFRKYGQFDEEQECLKYFRRLNRQWYFMNNHWLLPLKPLRWYVETLVGSFSVFVLAIVGWPAVFGLLSTVLHAKFGDRGDAVSGFGHHLANAYYSFFGLQPVLPPYNTPAHVLTLLLVIIGFAHLGIFISHLYSLVTRR
jgi:hypothetical protein